MSVWIDLLVAPRRPRLLERNQFRSLAEELLDHALVTMPCAILGGAISVEYPLAVANVAASFPGEIPEDLDIYYKGDDRVSLIKTLAEVPYGQSDLCIWFEGFNWQNPSLAESFGRQGYANADLLLYAPLPAATSLVF